MAKWDERSRASSSTCTLACGTRRASERLSRATSSSGPIALQRRVPLVPRRLDGARARACRPSSRPTSTPTSATSAARSRRPAIAWSYDNRTAGFRIVGHGQSLRIECRIPGADANPYLAFAATLAAGLDGIDGRIEPPPPFEGDVYAAETCRTCRATLREAIAALEASAWRGRRSARTSSSTTCTSSGPSSASSTRSSRAGSGALLRARLKVRTWMACD